MKLNRKIARACWSALIVLLSVLMVGCDGTRTEVTRTNKCLQHDMFLECMESLPVGPTNTMTNDWDEVVYECRMTAYYHSQRLITTIKPECM